jgi:hypothetical protein
MGWKKENGIYVIDSTGDTEIHPTENKGEAETDSGILVPSSNIGQPKPAMPPRKMRRDIMRQIARQQRREKRAKIRSAKVVEEAVKRLVSIQPNKE